ncbi:unnamed protein product, partial [Durusdinium trenchii]
RLTKPATTLFGCTVLGRVRIDGAQDLLVALEPSLVPELEGNDVEMSAEEMRKLKSQPLSKLETGEVILRIS